MQEATEKLAAHRATGQVSTRQRELPPLRVRKCGSFGSSVPNPSPKLRFPRRHRRPLRSRRTHPFSGDRGQGAAIDACRRGHRALDTHRGGVATPVAKPDVARSSPSFRRLRHPSQRRREANGRPTRLVRCPAAASQTFLTCPSWRVVGVAGERVYLQGSFVVTASGQRSGCPALASGSSGESGNRRWTHSNTRIIVEFPSGSRPPSEGSTLSRDSRRPFLVTEVRKTSDGQVNVYVREVTRAQ